MEVFFLCFIPLFVALDVVGVLPIYVALTAELTEKEKRHLNLEACGVALLLGVFVLTAGKNLFRFLGITEGDFRIGGGIVLLCLAVADLLFSQHEQRRSPSQDIGAVPLGTPLIMGPAALTTLLILADSYGYFFTTVAFLANLLLIFLTLQYSFFIYKYIGKSGAQAIAKIASLFLAAIGVMMIRSGILEIKQLFFSSF